GTVLHSRQPAAIPTARPAHKLPCSPAAAQSIPLMRRSLVPSPFSRSRTQSLPSARKGVTAAPALRPATLLSPTGDPLSRPRTTLHVATRRLPAQPAPTDGIRPPSNTAH